MSSPQNQAPASKTVRLSELAVLFLRLGATAFGGPAAHVAMMEDECVRRRGWLTREKFLDLLGASNLIPGPTSTEMALHIGYLRAGWMGLLVAGVCFILPASIMVAVLAWIYVTYGSVLTDSGLLDGMKPVSLAIIAYALWKLGRTALRDVLLVVVAGAALVLALVGEHELLLLFGAGMVAVLVRAVLRRGRRHRSAGSLLGVPPALFGQAASGSAAVGLWPLFLIFLKVGAVMFGGGYVLFAFLRADLVERRQWLTEPQLLDAIAVGQLTPGPITTAATFIGYILRDADGQPLGLPGALVATVAIFLPAFILVGLSGPLVPLLRRSITAGDFLDGVNAAALALMAAVTWHLGYNVMFEVPAWKAVPAWLLALTSAVLLIRYRVNSAWVLVGGAVVGWIVSRLHGS